MTISLTFNAPTVPDQAEATFGRLRVPFNVPIVGASAPPPPPDPPTPPSVTNFTPPPGTPIFSTNPIQFDVTDPDGLAVVVIHVKYLGSDAYEVAYDGGAFSPLFSASTVQTIANGFHFTLRRQGGWPGSPYVYAIAVDSKGASV
jgi:hypothetical protein